MIRNFKVLAIALLAASVSFAGSAVAQEGQQTSRMMMVNPGGGGGGGYPGMGQARLGIQGQMLYGRGMKILSVDWNSPLRQVGAEHGDIVERINGRQINTLADYHSALNDSLNYNGGWVSLVIHNVRYGYEWGAQEHVYVSVRVLYTGGGYPVPVAGAAAGGGGVPYGGVIQTPGGGVISETPATSDGSAAQGGY
ncbi:MAG: PDZ domain-containing protein [Pirellulaceae bacterium]